MGKGEKRCSIIREGPYIPQKVPVNVKLCIFSVSGSPLGRNCNCVMGTH
jgi:hypothetical protein